MRARASCAERMAGGAPKPSRFVTRRAGQDLSGGARVRHAARPAGAAARSGKLRIVVMAMLVWTREGHVTA